MYVFQQKAKQDPRGQFLWRRSINAALLTLAVGCLGLPQTKGQAGFLDSFASPETRWELADSDTTVRMLLHRRTFEKARGGGASEQVQLLAGRGTYAYLSYQIDPARVIAELQPSVWIKADRTGIQLILRVVLPRSVDPQSGRPLKTLLRGDMYSQVGRWQKLEVNDVGKLLSRQERVLRAQFGHHVDAREAYVDMIVLNAYGGAGVTNVWIDELEISGHVPLAAFKLDDQQERALEAAASGAMHPANFRRGLSVAPLVPQREVAQVRFQGSVLTVDGQPVAPRIIEYNGEPFEWLKQLGFNAIQLEQTPTPQQLEQAAQLDLWLVAPPPQVDGFTLIPNRFDRVLAWSLGRRLGDDDQAATRQMADATRLADTTLARPLVCHPESAFRSYSRIADGLILDRRPIGRGTSFDQHQQWLHSRRGLVQPNTPLWVAVQTEPLLSLERQLAALGDVPPDLQLQPEQIRVQLYSAVAAGARGLLFRSRTRLDAPEPAQQMRARTLQMLNSEAKLMEPWIAGGQFATQFATDDGAQVSVLETERSQLLIVSRPAEHQQYIAALPAPSAVHLSVPLLSSSSEVYQVRPDGIEPLRHRRTAGGLAVTLEDVELTGLAIATHNPLVVHHVARALAGTSRNFPQWRFDYAAEQYRRLWEYFREEPRGRDRQAVESLEQAHASLTQAQQLLQQDDRRSADRYIAQARQQLDALQQRVWLESVAALPPASSPPLASFTTLTLHQQLMEQLPHARWSGNMLAAGDFEDLNHMLHSGWQQRRRNIENVEAAVELSLESPRSGRSCLHLESWTTSDSMQHAVLDGPPLWIVSAPVPVQQGQILRVSGWVKVPEPLRGSPESLKIFDTLSGEELALHISQTAGWEEFVFYRAADREGQMRLVFALTGLGEAWIDAVQVVSTSAGD